MKKSLLGLLILLSAINLFAQETSNKYWEKEKDVNGKLITYYFVKTDEQLMNNLSGFITKVTGVNNPYLMPNNNTIKQQMVSLGYIANNYPNMYKKMFESLGSNKQENSEELWKDFKYCFWGFSGATNKAGMFVLVNRANEKVYISCTMYMDKGLTWLYTNETLSLMENLLAKQSMR